jgi:glutaminyl-tRNA synthetase
MSDGEAAIPTNFIRKIIEDDLTAGRIKGNIATRFPPEPNGYLHIGHAKSICLNFGIARDYNGTCNLRFDDTNPHKENIEYVEAIQEDVHWLGYDWDDRLYYASDYFEQLYDHAVELIRKGKAYVCDLTAEQIREYRGTLTDPGRESPYRNRSIAENLDLFERMRGGEFDDGSRVLRARIDMASPNINLRDPTLYRIRHGVIHHQTGEEWCIYPMYDYTHPISDAIEGITHSLCTLEFEDHRPLYDWVLENISISCHPQQIEFSRLNLQYMVMSKRKLTELVGEGYVEGWDDPRLPTIAGMRRRGYSPASIREFCERIGISKSENIVEMGMLEYSVREDLNNRAPRRMAVLHPLKVTIKNYPSDKFEEVEAANHPQNESMGVRTLPFTREIYIDSDDFRVAASGKFKRLVSG